MTMGTNMSTIITMSMPMATIMTMGIMGTPTAPRVGRLW